VKEVCACGASFEYTADMTIVGEVEHVYEMVKDWRENHRHEMPESEPGDPLIHESGAATERAELRWDESRPIIGFTAG